MSARPKTAPSYAGLTPSSQRASAAAKGSSRKRDTACELQLRRALWRLGLRYRVARRDLPGKPDIVFAAARVAVFVDGDFWHGRDLVARLAKLQAGHNAPYWTAKIRRNVERDANNTELLQAAGWEVLRFWESELLADPVAAARVVEAAVSRRRQPRSGPA
ncbi:MAG: mismatch endonuclease, patch repair protein [Actinomycetota bacterium]|jgi:DNA mismatch endonuclease (patch repair protein)